MRETGLDRLLEDRRLNAVLAWVLVGFVALVAAGNAFAGDLMWAGFAGAVAVLAVVPPVFRRSATEMLPFEVLLLAVFPLVGRTFASVPVTGQLTQYLSVAALALIVAVELHLFTPVEMSVGFAVGFVVIATTAAAGVWAVARWVPDVLLGTQFLLEPGVPTEEIEHRLMWEFVWSTAAGILAGVVFEWYFRRRGRAEVLEVVEVSETERKRLHQALADRLGLDADAQRRLTWLMETLLVGMFFVGLYEGNTGVIVNTAVALGVTQLVPILERDYGIPMKPALTLWITTAVFLHAFGTVGFPWSETSPYRSIWWWDHLTHALSSSVVGAVGYATARAIDVHSDEVNLTPKFMFVFILLTVVAFGVFWEVIEFALGAAAAAFGSGSVLTQYGLGDTMLDLVFDIIGAVVVATWGTVYLADVVGALVARLDSRGG